MQDGATSVYEVQLALERIPKENDINMNVKFNVSGYEGVADYADRIASASPKVTPKPYANGGSFVVPASYGYEGFNMGGIATASSGETITATPQGQQQDGMNESRLASLVTTQMVKALEQAGIGR
jgi:hypothetical protein